MKGDIGAEARLDWRLIFGLGGDVRSVRRWRGYVARGGHVLGLAKRFSFCQAVHACTRVSDRNGSLIARRISINVLPWFIDVFEGYKY